MPAQFLQYLDSSQGKFPIVVRQAGMAEAVYWHSYFQPHIRRVANRVDRRWDWRWFFSTTSLLEASLGRQVKYYQYLALSSAASGGKLVPVGQVLLSVGYPFCQNPTLPCVYLWFLTATPDSVLQSFSIPKPYALEPLLDLVIQESLDSGYQGRIFLHAASKGGQDLMAKYSNIPQLTNVPLGQKILHKTNDGRYFFVDSSQAVAFSKNLDYLRY